MSTFEVMAPDGRTLEIIGETMPTEQELDVLFKATGTDSPLMQTQSVLDNEDGKVYNVPINMDGIDTNYAIQTQHKGADKGSFFGKVLSSIPTPDEWAFKGIANAAIPAVQAVWKKSHEDGVSPAAKMIGDRVERSFQSAERGAVEHLGSASDALLANAYHYQDKVALLKAAEKGDFSHWGDNLDDEQKAGILEERRQKVKWVEDLRAKNKAFWDKGAQILRPDEEMDELDRVFAGLGGAATSIAETTALTLATKNPTAGAALVSSLYYAMANTEYFDKAMEAGMDVDEAMRNAKIAGAIEGGIEFVGERALMGIAKIAPIQKISRRVLDAAIIKSLQSKVGRAAIKKIGTRHTNSIFTAAVKGGVVEGSEEAAQTYLGMNWQNYTGVANYDDDEILNETMFSFLVGSLPGAGAATIGSSIHNRQVRAANDRIKSVLKEQTPELTEQEAQVTADAIQEMLFQESFAYNDEMNRIVQKELGPDTMPDGLTAESLTAQTRQLLKEKYQMSDEDIDRTIKASLGMIDARNQFNEAYNTFYEGLSVAGRHGQFADAEARILAARATTLARAEGTDIKNVLDRWNLRFQQENSANLPQNDNAQKQAMYRSKLDNLESFVDDVFNNQEDTSARYFTNTSKSGVDFDIPRDTVLHDKKHSLAAVEWAEVANNIDNIERATLSSKKRYDGQSVLLKISTPSGKYGVVFEHMKNGRNIITTAFKDADAKIDDWIKNNSARAMQTAPTTQKGLLSGQSMFDIIAVLDENVNKPLYQLPAEAYNKQGKADVNSEAFKRWFGDSKVVNKNGKPLVVYHGSDFVFEEFETRGGKSFELPIAEGVYFSSSKAVAQTYSDNLYSVYLKMENPATYYAEGQSYNDIMVGLNSYISSAQRNGKDGVIVKDIRDDANGKGRKADTYIVFNPNQIKSVNNRGTFDANNDNIYYQNKQNPRGAYLRSNDESIIYLFENADASTVVHELGHFFLDDMRRFSDNEATKAQLDAIYKYVGSTDGKLTEEQHEYFANSFEVYLLDGRAPNTLLGKVFARFRKWIGGIWSEVRRLDGIKLSDDIRKTFDDMLGGRSLDFTMQVSGLKMAEALESGMIAPNVISKAIRLLDEGRMSRADMDSLIERLKSGELKRSDVNQELKKFENNNITHHEALNPFDKMKYKSALQRGNFNKKDVVDKINRLLKWTEPRTQGGKVVGRFASKAMNDKFDHIRKLVAMDKNEAREKIAENVKLINAMIKGEETGDMDSLVFDNKILSIPAKKADATLLLDVYNAISDSYNAGRLTTAVTAEAKRKRKKRMIGEAVDVLTNGGTVDWRKERGKARQFVNQLGTSQMSWSGLMDILSMNDKSSKTGQSALNRNLDVFEAEQAEALGVADDGEKASRLIEKGLSSADNAGISLSRYVNEELKKETTIEWGSNRRTFTKDQLLDIWMKAQDRETREMMKNDEILQYNDAFLAEVNEVLTAQDRAVGNALFEFYDDNYQKINAFYEDKYGTSLGKRPFYSPRSMERGGINVDTGDVASYAGFSGIKQRTANAGAVKIKGAFAVLQDYIVNSNHWIAWSDKLIDINAVMGDVKVKTIISNLFGKKMESRISYEVSRMASNDRFQNKFGYGELWNKIRSNYAVAALAAKPALMIKQWTSFPAYWEHMSTAEFMEGLADFATHPKEAMQILGSTTLMKTRDVNIIKDFAELSKLELFKKNTGKVKLRELMMGNIKLGDRFAIYLGGWALYKAGLKKNLAAGMSEAEAKKKALNRFERVTDETQQSGRLSQQSYWQSNPFLRAFTMFQSSQNQYLRKEINAVRGLMSGRMDKGQAAKTLFIYHVLLPCLFQWASDGFDWDKKAQLRAGLLGSLNGIFILNSVLENGLDIALGTSDAWQGTKLAVRDVVPFWGSGEDLAKFFIKLAEGDIDVDEYMDVVKAFGKPAGELTGIPVKYPLDVIQNFGSYAEDGKYFKEVLLWLGWSPYALREKDED